MPITSRLVFNRATPFGTAFLSLKCEGRKMLGLKSPRLASWQLGNKRPADATNLVAQLFAAQCVDAQGLTLAFHTFMRQINA